MVVTWQNPFLQPTRPPGFVAPEEWGQETPTQLPNQGVGGVGAPEPIEQVQSMFTPAEATGGGMFGGDGGGGNAQPQPNQPEGDFPSASSIDRRRKLAEALMGRQMEVNHPMQAVANAVSQIAGAWMNKKADDEQSKLEKRRRETVSGGFEKSGGNFEAMMDEWMKSGDPELVDKALDYKLRKAAAAADGGDAPTTRNFYEGNAVVTKQWNAETKQWETVGSPSPRWKASGGVDDSGEDFGPVSAPVSAPADGKDGVQVTGDDLGYKTPGPPGKRGYQKGPEVIGPDGKPVRTTYNPRDGNLYYRGKDGLWRVASGPQASGKMTPGQYWKTKKEWQDEVNGLEALNDYFNTVKDIPTGINRWANDWSARAKTFFNSGELTPDEFNQKTGSAQIVALKGLFRLTIVGPGVMTDQDAAFILQALGDDPASSLQNPAVLEDVLKRLYERKKKSFKVLDKAVQVNAEANGDMYESPGIPDELGGGAHPPAGERGSAPTPSAPRPTGSKVVLPPKEKRIIGKTEYKAPNGQSFVWGRDASGKVGWIPK